MARPLLHGVFLGSHAVAAGLVTRPQLNTGVYRRLLRNVYVDPGIAADHRLVARGAALLLPEDAVLGGRTAAAWFGAPFASMVDPVFVVAPPASPWLGPKGVRVHRTTLRPDEVTSVEDGVRSTTALRTAWDVATSETVPNAVGYLDAMVRTGHVDTEMLARMLADNHGRWRSTRVATVVPLVDGRSQSPPESWLRVACVRSGLPAPVPQFAVVEDGVFLGCVDLAWPERRLAVEYEGEYHFDGVQIARDDVRYERLVAAGWEVIRVAVYDLRNLAAVVERIRRALMSFSGVRS